MPADPIHHVVASIAEEASGPSYSVPALAMASERLGRKVVIHTSRSRELPNPKVKIELFPHWMERVPIFRAIHHAPGLYRKMEDLPHGSIVHGHGLWLMPNVISAAAGAREDIKVVHAPRGMLGAGALQFSSTKKKLFWQLLQMRAVRNVDCWHATSEKEVADIRNCGLKQPIALVPNGIDIPTPPQTSRSKTVLFLGRIHPKKGIDTLLKVWRELEARFPSWRLDIAGPADNEYGAEYRQYIAANGIERARFIGPIYGKDKGKAYAEASLFVLPTLDENFGLTVGEALANETPAIVSHGAPWEGLVSEDCGWWHPIGEEPLLNALSEAMSTSPELLQEMGKKGRAWVARDFGWPSLASLMEQVYDWLGDKADRPDFVVTD